jgi:hypothetical protein
MNMTKILITGGAGFLIRTAKIVDFIWVSNTIRPRLLRKKSSYRYGFEI